MSVGGKAVSGKEAAALALHRFGFGPVGDQINAIAADPRGALQADLDRPAAGELKVDLPSSAEAARAVFDFQAKRRAQQILAQRAQKEADANDSRPDMADAGNAVAPPQQPNQPPLPQQLILNEAKARFDAAAGAEIGFVERLVWFWSNHFCISADKIVGMAGPYEREAIRPHVLGRFADLLQAVEGHPAMLYYLDNVELMGPNSIAGINRDKGLNENLARETLELHTLGVRSGYTQTDVTNFAKVLTGWTWIPPSEPSHGGEFVFNARLHEPVPQTVLGKSYPQAGMDQGRAVLADLARHPATAQHIAQQLAAHFIADEPPPALVAKLAKSFNDSDGNLKEVAKTSDCDRRILVAAAAKAEGSRAVGGGRASAHWRAGDGTHRPGHERASNPRRTVMAAAGAERLFRHRSGLDRRRAEATRCCQCLCRTDAGGRPAGAPRNQPWAARVSCVARDRCSRGNAQAGFGSSRHDTGVSAQLMIYGE